MIKKNWNDKKWLIALVGLSGCDRLSGFDEAIRQNNICETINIDSSESTELGFSVEDVQDVLLASMPSEVVWEVNDIGVEEAALFELTLGDVDTSQIEMCESVSSMPGGAVLEENPSLRFPISFHASIAERQILTSGLLRVYAASLEENSLFVSAPQSASMSGDYYNGVETYIEAEYDSWSPEMVWTDSKLTLMGGWPDASVSVSVYYSGQPSGFVTNVLSGSWSQ